MSGDRPRLVAGRGVLLLLLGLALAACSRGPASRGLAPPDPLAEISAADLFARGVELRGAGDFVRAEQYLSAAADRGHPEEAVVAELVGVCIDATRYQAALRYANPYLARNPDDWALRYVVASLYVATGEVDEARDQLELAIATAPDAPGPHYLLATTLADTDLAMAIAEFQAYLALEPDGTHSAEARAWLRRHGAGDKAAPSVAPADDSQPVEPPVSEESP